MPTPRLTVTLLLLLLAGCGGTTGEPASPEPSPTAPDDPTSMPTDQPPTDDEEPTVPSDVPDAVIDRVLSMAGDATGAAVEDVEVLRAQAVTWRDGSLGCPEPGQVYTQALVEGYWVVVRTDGRELDYRAGPDGTPRLCEGGGGPPLGTGDA